MWIFHISLLKINLKKAHKEIRYMDKIKVRKLND